MKFNKLRWIHHKTRRARFIVATADLSARCVLADKSAVAMINLALRLFEMIGPCGVETRLEIIL